jgi:hypothetical protein
MKKSSMNALMTMEIDFVEFHIQTMVQNDDLLPKKKTQYSINQSKQMHAAALP